jgi:hypothetical protein
MSISQTRCAVAALVLVALTSAASVADEVSTSSDLAAALLVAYNDYAQVTAKDSRPMTVAAFRTHFEKVSISLEGETAIVRFQPPYREHTTGGSVIYSVNLKTLAISDRIFGR